MLSEQVCHTFWTAKEGQKSWAWCWEKLVASGIVSSWTVGEWFQKAKGHSPVSWRDGGRVISIFCTFSGSGGKEKATDNSVSEFHAYLVCLKWLGRFGKILDFPFWFKYVTECSQELTKSFLHPFSGHLEVMPYFKKDENLNLWIISSLFFFPNDHRPFNTLNQSPCATKYFDVRTQKE